VVPALVIGVFVRAVVAVLHNTHTTQSSDVALWPSYDRIWFCGSDEQEIFILIWTLYSDNTLNDDNDDSQNDN
jgi:hypothetical protein